MAYNYEYPYVDPGMYNDDWLLKKMKQLIAEWEAMQVKFTTLEEYVKNYFANLDVQDEINNKIDAMIADGSFYTQFIDRLNPSPYMGKSVVLSGDLSVNSPVGNRSLLANCAYVLGTDVTDLSSSGMSLLTPGHTYYNALSSIPSTNRFRYVFVMLEESDYSYGLTNIANALQSLGTLSSSHGAQLYVIPRPLHSQSATKDELMHNYWYSQFNSDVFRVVSLEYIPGLASSEWIVSNSMISGYRQLYTKYFTSHFTAPYFIPPANPLILIPGNGIEIQLFYTGGNYLSCIIGMYVKCQLSTPSMPQFPLKVRDFICRMSNRNGQSITISYINDSLALSGSPQVGEQYNGLFYMSFT